MANEKSGCSRRRIHRREFFGIGARTAAVLAALPAASWLLAGCGSGEPAPSAGTPEPRQPAPPPAEPAPQAPAPVEPSNPPSASPAPTPGGDGAQRLVTEVEAMATMVSALQYVHESPQKDRNCANCQLYTAGGGGRGKCQLFVQGLVKETGWCTSWVAKVTS